jgi:hypothetical protein
MKPTVVRDFAGTVVLVSAVSVISGAYATGRNEMLSGQHAATLSSGTVVDLRSATRLTSQLSFVGSPLTATALRALVDERGDTIIPVGAEFVGTVTAIAAAERSGERGTLDVAFQEVRVGADTHRIATRVISLGTYSLGRGKVNHPRDRSIILPAGGVIRLELTQPFAPELSSAR